MHRDIKPENILYVHGGEGKGNGRVKLVDFGTAVKFKKGEKYSEIYGSANYLAPEVVNMDYTEKCDVWSLGVILYTILLKQMPFDGNMDAEVIKAIKNNPLSF